jgi:hypothetical protein
MALRCNVKEQSGTVNLKLTIASAGADYSDSRGGSPEKGNL